MLKMKKCDFDREAKALSSAFASLAANSSKKGKKNNNNINSDPASLIYWVAEESLDPNHRNRSNTCLSHPPYLRPYFGNDSMVCGEQKTSNIATTEDVEEEEEDSFIEIDEATLNEPHEEPPSNNRPQIIEWIFNVCYSDTWSVPVLYFRVQRVDGTTLTRSEVLHALNYSETATAGDSWDFVSEEEHPITGIPSFFLHPCQTSSRLLLLEEGLSDAQKCRPGFLLLGWLSMVLPAVQCRIASEEFHCLRENLI